jgi:P-loop containing NTP hydrolase pore-1
VRIGCKHPDPVVESLSLSSVESPNVTHRLLIPDEVIDSSCLSALQLETIVYCCQKHEERLPSKERAGFLIGVY